MIEVDTNQIKELQEDLKVFADRAYPFATKQTINRSAFKAQQISREIVKDEMIQRNKFTVQSIQVDQARTLNVNRQEATVGSTADYMEDQEFGGSKSKSGKQGVSIATSYSAGQGESAQPRTRLSTKPNKLASIRLKRQGTKARSRKQKNFIAIREAAQSGSKYVYLDLGRRQAIFKVIGGKRRPKIKMVHDLTRKTVVIPKNPWLAPAVKQTEKHIPQIYKESLEFQAKRAGLFR